MYSHLKNIICVTLLCNYTLYNNFAGMNKIIHILFIGIETYSWVLQRFFFGEMGGGREGELGASR